MELGEKLKTARLEAGLSQRQLAGDMITRNMLSRIENGAARPSMDTLAYLSQRLGKSIAWFLESEAVTSPNQDVMTQARDAWEAGDWETAAAVLAAYRGPDPVFQREWELLHRLTELSRAEAAAASGRDRLALRLLESLGPMESGYCAGELERRRLLLLGTLRPGADVCSALPALDRELLLRAGDALNRGDLNRAAQLLDAAENREEPRWLYLRGQVHMAAGEYREAAAVLLQAEAAYPRECAAGLERCFRELGDYERAYHYACKQR